MAASPGRIERAAFYALRPGGWRDLVTLLHPPYTAWHLSYVALGAAAAPALHLDRLGASLGAFFLAVGIASHALDEHQGRPLATSLSDRLLVALAVCSLAGAVAIGIAGALTVSATIFVLVAAGALLVPAYNLELFGGRVHGDLWFALAWGAYPAFVGFWANSLKLTAAGALVTAACFVLSLGQRRLSTPVRELRRRTVAVTGEQRLRDGRRIELTAVRLAEPLDGALSALSLGVVLLACAAVAIRV